MSVIKNAVVALGLVASGCFFEFTTAYHPKVNTRVTMPNPVDEALASDEGGWSAGLNVGIYHDLPWANRYFRGLGVGLSPSQLNGHGIPSDPDLVKTGGNATVVRGDIHLPVGSVGHRGVSVTGAYYFLGDGISATIYPDPEAAQAMSKDGSMWFLGATTGVRIPVFRKAIAGDFIGRVSLGVERYRSLVENVDGRTASVRSTGIGARLLIVVPVGPGGGGGGGGLDTSGNAGSDESTRSCSWACNGWSCTESCF